MWSIESRREGWPHGIFLHGFLGDGQDWSKVLEYYPKDWGYTVYNLPGHGGNSIEVGKGFDEYCEDLYVQSRDILEQDGFLVGYSLGSRLALHYAYRTKFSRVVLVAPSMRPWTAYQRKMRRFSDQGLIKKIKRVGWEQFLRDWYSLPMFGDIGKHENIKEVIARRAKNCIDSIEICLEELGQAKTPLYQSQDLEGIRVWVVYGQLDQVAQESTEYLNQLGVIKEEVSCPNVAHSLLYECPKELVQIIQNGIHKEEL